VRQSRRCFPKFFSGVRGTSRHAVVNFFLSSESLGNHKHLFASLFRVEKMLSLWFLDAFFKETDGQTAVFPDVVSGKL